MGMMEQDLPQLLVDCIRKNDPGPKPEALAALTEEDWHGLLTLAASQRVKPLLWHRLKEKGLGGAVPKKVAEEFDRALRRNSLRNLGLHGELHKLLSALTPEGISVIPLKGMFLADAVYGNTGLREMNDIDLLARAKDLSRIADILMSMGYKGLQPVNADITLKAVHHLPRMVRTGHAAFEIHWSLTHPNAYYHIDPEELWERAVPVHIAGCDMPALSPEDLLLHLCLHTSYQHLFAFGLRPSCDIAETIAHFGPVINWQALKERTVRWGLQRGVCMALTVAQELGGADVPAEILKTLRPSDMGEGVMQTVRTHIFTDKSLAVSVPGPFAELLEKKRLAEKLLIFWQRIFLPKTVIASIYSIPADSLKIYFCYPRRFIDVLRRHGSTLREHRRSMPLKALAEQTNCIVNSLAGPAMHQK